MPGLSIRKQNKTEELQQDMMAPTWYPSAQEAELVRF